MEISPNTLQLPKEVEASHPRARESKVCATVLLRQEARGEEEDFREASTMISKMCAPSMELSDPSSTSCFSRTQTRTNVYMGFIV